MGSSGPGRARVERGIYRQPNGKYAVCWRHAGRLRFRTVSYDLAAARRERLALIMATRAGSVPVSPRLRFETVAGWWLDRFEAKVAAGERHSRTLEAHRYQLDRHLLPALGRRRIASLTVDDVAELLHDLRRAGRSAKTSASALATLPERDALRPPVRLDRRRPGRAAPPARPQPRRDRAPPRRLPAGRSPDGGDRHLHRPAHIGAPRPRLGRRGLRGRRDSRARAALACPPRRSSPPRRAENPRLGPRRSARRPARRPAQLPTAIATSAGAPSGAPHSLQG
jgi:hypothetical protein